MSPIIVLRGGKLRAVVGASGGPLIVSSVFQTLLRILAECNTPLEAVTQPRYHHQVLLATIFDGTYPTDFYLGSCTLDINSVAKCRYVNRILYRLCQLLGFTQVQY